MTFSIAIVGAGPAGLYAADALLRKVAGARIDVIERLPTPFGLIRFGVAPDHQGTKAVARVLARTLERPDVRFLGNVEIGRDASIRDLRALYHAVVLATGAPDDRRLDISGEDLPGVFGSAAFVGWYNGHPDHAGLRPNLDVGAVAIIGNGNVALDVARILGKTPEELAKSDIVPAAAAAIATSSVRDIHVIGRRGPAEAAFANAELTELGQLARCVPLVDINDLADPAGVADHSRSATRDANLATFRAFAANRPDARPLRLHFHFHLTPVAIAGTDHVEGLRLSRTGRPVAETFDLSCGLVVTCIGYRGRALDGLPFDPQRGLPVHHDGVVAERLYVMGWARRGPSGVIATNRTDAVALAERIATDLGGQAIDRPGPEGMDRLLQARQAHPVSHADWRRIEAAEIAAAPPGVPRRKFTRVADMLSALSRHGA